MQLTDAEIREILIRRKRAKKLRQQRRRRRTLLILLLIIIVIIALVKCSGHSKGTKGSADTSSSPAASDESADQQYSGDIRGTIFIDPGHGGMDSGSDDDHDRYEKDDTLRLSLAVRENLEALGFHVEMSRTDDTLVDRTERGQMANKAGAQLFVSIHRNKADGDGHGVEGFIPSQDDSDSRLLGETIMHELGRAGFTERTIRAGTLYDPKDDYEEIAATNMPSVLIEVGFLSSSVDNELFDNNLGRNARAIANAVNITFMTLHEPEKAAEYAARQSAAEAASDQVISATTEAVSGASAAFAPAEGSDSEETGIDPQA